LTCAQCKKLIVINEKQNPSICLRCCNFIHPECVNLHKEHQFFLQSSKIFSNTTDKFYLTLKSNKALNPNVNNFAFINSQLQKYIKDVSIPRKPFDINLLKKNTKEYYDFNIFQKMNANIMVAETKYLKQIVCNQQITFSYRMIFGWTKLGSGIFMIENVLAKEARNEVYFAIFSKESGFCLHPILAKLNYYHPIGLYLANINDHVIYLIPALSHSFEKYDILKNKWLLYPKIQQKLNYTAYFATFNNQFIYYIWASKDLYQLDTFNEENGWIKLSVTENSILDNPDVMIQYSNNEILFITGRRSWNKFNPYLNTSKSKYYPDLSDNFFSGNIFIRKHHLCSFSNADFHSLCLWSHKMHSVKLTQHKF